MDEIWVRVGVVAAALLVAGSIAIWRRTRGRSPIREVSSAGLGPGIYFFSSATCPTCKQARDELDRVLGEGAYVELRWEEQRAPFAEIGVDAVPAVLIVTASGNGRLFPGQPDRALSEL